MIRFVQKGDFSNSDKFFQRLLEFPHLSDMDKYGQLGVEALRLHTPRDTGKTANSWSYEIKHTDDGISIVWTNSNLAEDWCPVAILLQYGHATKNGGWVEGVDYINPALKPIFDNIARDAWLEVTKS